MKNPSPVLPGSEYLLKIISKAAQNAADEVLLDTRAERSWGRPFDDVNRAPDGFPPKPLHHPHPWDRVFIERLFEPLKMKPRAVGLSTPILRASRQIGKSTMVADFMAAEAEAYQTRAAGTKYVRFCGWRPV